MEERALNLKDGTMKNSNSHFKKQFVQTTEQVCKKFGCGKKLKDYEALASDYCFKHAQEIAQQNQNLKKLNYES